MDTDGGNSESRQHDRVFLHSFIVLDSLVQALVVSLAHQLKSTRGWWWMVPLWQKKWQCFWLWHLWENLWENHGKSPHSKVATHWQEPLRKMCSSISYLMWQPQQHQQLGDRKWMQLGPDFEVLKLRCLPDMEGNKFNLTPVDWVAKVKAAKFSASAVQVVSSVEFCSELIVSLPNIIKTPKHESPWVYQSVHHQHIIFDFHMETSLEIPTVPFFLRGGFCRPSWALL